MRELAEECALVAADWREVGGFWAVPAYSTEFVHVFEAGWPRAGAASRSPRRRRGHRGAARPGSTGRSTSCPTPSRSPRSRLAGVDVIRAVVFDFNGTLSDDEPILCEIWQEIAAEHGRPLSREEYFGQLAGLADPEIAERWLGVDADVEAVMAERVRRYRELVADGSTRRPGDARRGALRGRAGSGRHVSRAPLAADLSPSSTAAGLADAFPCSLRPRTCAAGKPDPEGYHARESSSWALTRSEVLASRGQRGRRARGEGGGDALHRAARDGRRRNGSRPRTRSSSGSTFALLAREL